MLTNRRTWHEGYTSRCFCEDRRVSYPRIPLHCLRVIVYRRIVVTMARLAWGILQYEANRWCEILCTTCIRQREREGKRQGGNRTVSAIRPPKW